MKRKILIALCVVLALVLLAVGASAAYIRHMLGKIRREEPVLPPATSQPAETQSTQPAPATEPAPTEPEDVTLNFLLIGQDKEENESRQRSDVMILATVNPRTAQLTLTSLQRDMHLPIPGNGEQRLNAAYYLGGMQLLGQTLLENFELTVDGMVAVDFGGFSEIVDMLGGVSITLTEAEARELRLSPGQQTLGGKKALEYARLRSIDSDFHRTNRQRTVLIALLERHREFSLLDLHRLLSACLSLTSTNLTDSQILSYATELFPLLRKLEITSGSVPLDGQYTEAVVADREVLIPDIPAITETLHEITQE